MKDSVRKENKIVKLKIIKKISEEQLVEVTQSSTKVEDMYWNFPEVQWKRVESKPINKK